MKYAVILPDGAADEPVDMLGGRTPLEMAAIPNIDWISTNGRQGRVTTVPKGFGPGSDVCTMSLLGYNPAKDYTGRAPLEAAARDIAVGGDDLVFRCNLVTIVEGVMDDFTAGHISSGEAATLIADLDRQVAGGSAKFHPGVSYRHLLVLNDATDVDCTCTPPHDIIGKKVRQYLPKGAGADRIKGIMDRASVLLSSHEINDVRRDLGENQATDIWLWGQGTSRPLESFRDRYGVRGAVIAAVDLVRGIAKLLGMDLIDVPGATGYLDTDYRGKGQAAVKALDEYDLVLVHVEAPDEAGHNGDAKAKIQAIERIDKHIVGPVLDKLRTFDRWKILIAPDHPTPVGKRTHTADPPPFCLAGTGVHAVLERPFTEKSAAGSDLQIEPGHSLMQYFLKP
ncbi:MAG: cofactor-independent phosphoglycerate mutase [Phycisphaerales bacterium]|nr:MAG: cofactor-independent phosphoglycerate mutase [Phycisphaerales bacterium]